MNLALRDIRNGGIIAVNGPPGTGKTTLLRDIVAALVAERAEVMCGFANPVDAFAHSKQKLKAGNGWLHLYSLDPSLRGYEILVASSNNKAVENVSEQLPGASAVATDSGLAYFKPLSDALLERPTWGLIAAVLGNAANRGWFRKTFWWDREVGLATYLAEAAGTPQWVDEELEGTNRRHRPRIVEEAQAPDGPAAALRQWSKARESFRRRLKDSREILAELARIRRALQTLPVLAAADAKTQETHKSAMEVEKAARHGWEVAKGAYSTADTKWQIALRQLGEHDAIKPSFWARLIRSRLAKAWAADRDPLALTVQSAVASRSERSVVTGQREKEWRVADSALRQCSTEAQKSKTNFTVVQQQVDTARIRLGDRFVDSAFFENAHAQRHLSVPWCDEAAQRARDEVFVAAMALHKSFVDAAAKPIRHNLGALMNSMGPAGGALTGAKAALLPDVWATLFLVVPVVSTTFASVERMMGALPAESLGWLLIDEAGQALPQAAVGALMRTRRAVVVGDPVQIEPVVSLPETLTQTICRRFGIEPDIYNAPTASAQTLADAATPYFAEFQGRFGSRTVGVPLLVHRRCAEPMFGIANAVAYERLMVQAKLPKSSRIRDCLGPSAWLNVEGSGNDKWCPEEGEKVLSLLRRLATAEVPANIYIVSPFVIVAENLRKIISKSGVLRAWTDDEYAWINERIGTVHTVQGREAEAVIFVLGAPDPLQRGARGWAGGRPNLLNVAVTRAQEVLYVVGNRNLWRDAGVFRQLHEGLP